MQSQGDAIRNITWTVRGDHKNPAIYGGNSEFWGDDIVSSSGAFQLINYYFQKGIASVSPGDQVAPHGFTLDASLVVPTAEENRPVNISVRYLIKALD